MTAEQERLLDNTFIQATIVDTDGSQRSLESIYQIFERLNSGGTQLTAHEIRVALFAGPLIDYLEELNKDTSWRDIYGKVSPRVRDQELVLRILALYVQAPNYRRPLKAFLNSFVAQYRDKSGLAAELLADRFAAAAGLIDQAGGRGALRLSGYQVNAALTEALFVGLMRRLDQGSAPGVKELGEALTAVRVDPALLAAVSRATADEESVRSRLEIATAAFSRI